MENFINNAPFALVLVCLVIGFVLLIKGADFFVEGSSSAAKRLHVPSIIIGLTIVAMGTSLPETAVSVSASLTGNNELAVSNVIGSNIFNLMVVIGVCAVLTTVEVAKETIKRDIPLSLICAGLLMVLGISGLGDKSSMMLGHLDGVILIGFFAGYIVYMVQIALKANRKEKKSKLKAVPTRTSTAFRSEEYRVHRRRSSRHCSRRRCDRRCRSKNRGRSWNEPDSDRTDHCFHRNFPSGTRNFYRCCQKE